MLTVATRLGFTCFGGPVAHVGYFRDEYVKRRGWIDEATYADLVALSQSLPGPASSKLGMAIGILRAGLPGGVAAWLGFTLPSAIALVVVALLIQNLSSGGWLRGLKIVAVAVIAQAIWGMARTLTPDRPRVSIAIAAACVMLAWPVAWTPAVGQVVIIALAGLIGWRLFPATGAVVPLPIAVPIGRWTAAGAIMVLIALLVGLPLARQVVPDHGLALFDSFFRVGALVFGGGHVVLPLLQGEVVPPGWVTSDQFLAGYGAAQAVPGPLFTFAAYLGAIGGPTPNGVLGAVIATVAIFLPAFLIVVGTLPSWGALRSRPAVQGALRAINAAVVGLLLAALYTSGWTTAIRGPIDVAIGLAAFAALLFWSVPPWIVVMVAAVGGWLLASFVA